MLRGDYSLKYSFGTYLSTWLFLDAWEISLKLFHDGNQITYLTLAATGLSDTTRNLYHAFHFHPTIEKSEKWTGIDEYDTGPHIHVNYKNDVKLIVGAEFVALDRFLLFVVGRHHRDVFPKVQKLFAKFGNATGFGMLAMQS